MTGNFRKALLIITILVLVLFIAYSSYALYLSFKMNDLIDKAMDGVSYELVEDLIEKDDYDLMNPRDVDLETDENGMELNNISIDKSHSFPIVLPFVTNKVTYTYKYYVINNDKAEDDLDRIVYGDGADADWCEVYVNIDFSKYPFYVTNVELAP